MHHKYRDLKKGRKEKKGGEGNRKTGEKIQK